MARKIVEVELKAVGADKAVQEINEVTQSLNQLEKQEQKNTQETESLTDSVTTNGGAMGILNELTGGMAQRFKDSYEALALTNKGLTGLKGALLATGIGAAVIAVGYLVANFRDVQIALGIIDPKMEKLNETMDEANVAAHEAARGLQTLQRIILDTTRSEEVRESALKELSKTVVELNDVNLDQVGALKQVVAMTAPYIKATMARAKADAFAKLIAEEQAELIKNRAVATREYNEEVAGGVNIFNAAVHRDFALLNREFDQQAEFLDELGGQYDDLVADAVSAESALIKHRPKPPKPPDVVEPVTEAIKKGTLAQQEYERDLQENMFFIPGVGYVRKETFEILKNRVKEEDKRIQDLQTLRNRFKEEEEVSAVQKLELQRQIDIKSVEELGGTLADKAAITAFYNEKIKKANQEAADADTKLTKETEAEKLQQIQGAASDIIGIVGASSKFGKGIAIASAIQDTYAGANKAFKQGGTFGFISAAAIIAAGLRNVQKIVATKTPKPPPGILGTDTGAEPNISIPSSATAAPSLPPEFSTVGASGVNQLADVLGGQSPVRAFVVSGDVSTAQQLDRNIIQSASLG